jgi:hypothetical protein
MSQIEMYLASLAKHLRPALLDSEIQETRKEFAGHLRDHANALIDEGTSKEEAECMAATKMGSPRRVANAIIQAHLRPIGQSWIAPIVALSLIGIYVTVFALLGSSVPTQVRVNANLVSPIAFPLAILLITLATRRRFGLQLVVGSILLTVPISIWFAYTSKPFDPANQWHLAWAEDLARIRSGQSLLRTKDVHFGNPNGITYFVPEPREITLQEEQSNRVFVQSPFAPINFSVPSIVPNSRYGLKQAFSEAEATSALLKYGPGALAEAENLKRLYAIRFLFSPLFLLPGLLFLGLVNEVTFRLMVRARRLRRQKAPARN